TLQTRVGAALAELAMAGARLVPVVTAAAARDGDDAALVFDGRRLGPTGWDRVEFQLAANKGEEPRPLHRIASGGELSRIMLALKRILSRADQVATYVFDEVDAGIGGAVADVVGRQIRAVAEDKQVVCITHLPQIAAHAAAHFRVEKQESDGRVRTIVRELSASERKEEIARMLGGKVTPKARAHAEELLRGARAET
ncbi:MAG TPA: DNA repair protein RecN, partial [Polyangia bacterium]|nr:DNA repair protein RecN [Polyangia bacterium]